MVSHSSRQTAVDGHDVYVRVAIVIATEGDLRAVGREAWEYSSPRGELNRCAKPPVLGASQMSPVYTNAICVSDTSGYRNMRASIAFATAEVFVVCAGVEAPTK